MLPTRPLRSLIAPLATPLLAPLVAVAACAPAESSEPHQVQPAASDPNFVLYVTNRGADTVDISVLLDDELAVEGDFPAGQDYSFDFEIPAGGHSINSSSEDAATQRIDGLEIRAGVVYGVVQFWDEATPSGQPGPIFTFELLDEPPAFEGSAEGAKN